MDGQGTGGASGEESLKKSATTQAAESENEVEESDRTDAAQPSSFGEATTATSGASAADDSRSAEPAEIQQLQSELERLQAEKKSLEDQFLRLRAEFENFRRRTRQEAEERREWAAANLVSALLPVVDNLERATQVTKDGERAPQSFVEGVELVRKQLLGELERAGLKAIEAVGSPFDPNLHEAVLHEESDEYPDGHVIEEFQRGYTLGDKVLRASMVKVAKGT